MFCQKLQLERTKCVGRWQAGLCNTVQTRPTNVKSKSGGQLIPGKRKVTVCEVKQTKREDSGITKDIPVVENIELQEKLDALKEQSSKREEKPGFVQGLLQEVQLIEWPKPKQAVLDTVLVLAIVGGSAILLFATNTVLAEVTKEFYSK